MSRFMSDFYSPLNEISKKPEISNSNTTATTEGKERRECGGSVLTRGMSASKRLYIPCPSVKWSCAVCQVAFLGASAVPFSLSSYLKDPGCASVDVESLSNNHHLSSSGVSQTRVRAAISRSPSILRYFRPLATTFWYYWYHYPNH